MSKQDLKTLKEVVLGIVGGCVIFALMLMPILGVYLLHP